MVSIRKSYEPTGKNAARYDKFFNRAYKPFHDRVADLLHEIAAINDETDAGSS
jgi:predicted N-formylglutamate amidohydrolase